MISLYGAESTLTGPDAHHIHRDRLTIGLLGTR